MQQTTASKMTMKFKQCRVVVFEGKPGVTEKQIITHTL